MLKHKSNRYNKNIKHIRENLFKQTMQGSCVTIKLIENFFLSLSIINTKRGKNFKSATPQKTIGRPIWGPFLKILKNSNIDFNNLKQKVDCIGSSLKYWLQLYDLFQLLCLSWLYPKSCHFKIFVLISLQGSKFLDKGYKLMIQNWKYSFCL